MSFDENQNQLIASKASPIDRFYHQKTILITGATGFCGKVLLAKVLTSLHQIHRLYVLIRPKTGLSARQRFERLISSKPFTFLRLSRQQLEKIRVLEGDLIQEGLGLNSNEILTLISEVNIVFHAAASVKFMAPLSYNIQHNVFATETLIDLTKRMSSLECFVHVSTAYSNCHRSKVDEKLCPMLMDHKEMIDLFRKLDDEQLAKLAPQLFEGRPNSYIFSKAIAEHFVHGLTESGKRVAIVRPSIVAPAKKEPVPGWVDSMHGPMSLCLLWATGLMCVVDWDFATRPDFIPVDSVANCAIVAPWFLAKKSESFKVFNLVRETFYDGEFDPYKSILCAHKVYMKAPPSLVMRPNLKLSKINNRSPVRYKIEKFLFHTLYAVFLDMIVYLCGHKPFLARILGKTHEAVDAMKYFGHKEWTFVHDNVSEMVESMEPNDRKTFDFGKSSQSLEKIFDNFWIGTRRFLLKQPDSDIASAKVRYFIAIFAYRIFVDLIYYWVVRMVWPVVLPNFPLNFTFLQIFLSIHCVATVTQLLWQLKPLLSNELDSKVEPRELEKVDMYNCENDQPSNISSS